MGEKRTSEKKHIPYEGSQWPGNQRRILDLFAGAVQILAGGVEGFEKIHAFTAAQTAHFLDG